MSDRHAASRGRPLHLPDDPAPATAPVTCGPRVGWLLAVNRVLGPDPALARRQGMLSRLADLGMRLDAPRLSRLEAGTAPAGARLLDLYEQALALPAGLLEATVVGLLRDLGPPGLPRAPAVGAEGLDERLGRALDGVADGADWLRAARALQGFDRVYLRADDWRRLTATLVAELATATGAGLVRRSEAGAALLTVPAARPHLLGAVADLVTDAFPAPRVLGLLAITPDPQATGPLLRLLGSPAEHHRERAATVLARKAARGHLDARGLQLLEREVEHTLAERGEGHAPPAALELPAASWGRVERRLRDRRRSGTVTRARATGELLPAPGAARAAETVTEAVRRATPARTLLEADPMLPRLVREALAHAHGERRRHAARLLAASPYAPGLARACLALTGDRDGLVAARAWSLLARLPSDPEVAPHVPAAALGADQPRRAGAIAVLGLGPTAPTPAQERQLAGLADRAGPAEREAALCALGMHRAPALDTLAGHPTEEVRRPAAWWRDRGGATVDPDPAEVGRQQRSRAQASQTRPSSRGRSPAAGA